MLGKKVNILVLTLLTLLSATSFADTQYSASVCDGSNYLFGCTPIAPADGSGTYDNGTQHVRLTFGSPIGKQYTATIVPGEKYIFGCEVLTSDVPTSIEKIKTLSQTGCECDSTVKLTLLVQAPVVLTDTTVKYSATIEQGETYLFGCDTLTKDTLIFKKLQRANGADSIIYLQLTVEPACPAAIAVGDTTAIVCEGDLPFLWHGKSLMRDTTMCDDTLRAVIDNKCDSIVRLKLIVQRVIVDSSATVYACPTEPYNWVVDGHDFGYFTQDTVYRDTLRYAETGCDSARYTLDLRFYQAKDSVEDHMIYFGDSYAWYVNGNKVGDYNTAGTYYDTLHNQAGCDSIRFTLNLTQECNPTVPVTDTVATVCESELPFLWHGKSLSSDTTMCDDTVKSILYACDSVIHRLSLTVLHPATGVDAVSGCDSVIFKGVKYTADAVVLDTLAGMAANGCDSIVTMTITVKHHATGVDAVSGCDSVIFKGVKYTADAVVLDTLAGGAANGCDSIVTVTITVKHHATGVDTKSNCNSVKFKGITYYESTTVLDTIVGGAANGCDSIVTVTITVLKPDTTVLPAVDSCNRYHLKTADIDTLITTTDNYKFVFQNANGCDSVVTINVTIATPYVDTLSLIHKFGDRLLMINRNEINAIPGWHLDSLDTDHPEYVSWYEIDPNGNVRNLPDGYTYSLPNGEPLPAGYTYYAKVNIPAVGGNCGAIGTTEHYTIPSAAPAPALMPSLARPGEEIRIVNLDPGTQTVVRIYSADGIMHGRYTVHGVESYTIKAAGTTGFYMVELTNESLQSTLRYIVK